MNGDVFEYGGHRFQPYAKYKADYDSLEPYFTNNFNFIHTKYNREDFFNKSPVKCCDVLMTINSIIQVKTDWLNFASRRLPNSAKPEW